MLIRTEANLSGLRRVGDLTARILRRVLEEAKVGRSTAELDAIAREELRRLGARSAPRLIYDFPGSVCISVNEEAAHGVPGARILLPGDLVNIDLSAEFGGYYADCALSLALESADPERRRIAAAAREILELAIGRLRPAVTARELGGFIEREAVARGYSTLLGLGGHGLGRAPHEAPALLEGYDNPGNATVFQPGMVLALEVFLSRGSRETRLAPDGWTLLSPPGTLVAQAEHTLLVTEELPEVLTLARPGLGPGLGPGPGLGLGPGPGPGPGLGTEGLGISHRRRAGERLENQA